MSFHFQLLLIHLIKKQSFQKNIKLKGKYHGRIFIILTGSTVNHIDLTPLKNEYVMGVNRAFLHPDWSKIKVDFFTLVDNWDYHRFASMAWITDVCFAKSRKEMKSFFDISASLYLENDNRNFEYRDKYKLFEKCNIHYVYGKGAFSNVDDVRGDIHKSVNTRCGSLYFAVSLAVYLGFKEVYLIGADYFNVPLTVGHFYDNLAEHWDRDKLNGGGNNQLYENMQKKEQVINDYCADNGVSLFSVVPDGYSSRCFKTITKQEYSTLLSGQ